MNIPRSHRKTYSRHNDTSDYDSLLHTIDESTTDLHLNQSLSGGLDTTSYQDASTSRAVAKGISALHDKIAALEKANETLTQTNNVLTKKNEELSSQTLEFEGMCEDLVARCEKLKSNVTSLTDELATKESEQQSSTKQLEELHKEVETITKDMQMKVDEATANELKKDEALAELKSDFQTLAAKYEVHEQVEEKHTAELKQATDQTLALQKAHEGEIERANNQMNALQDSLRVMSETLMSTNYEKQTLEETVASLTRQLTVLESQTQEQTLYMQQMLAEHKNNQSRRNSNASSIHSNASSSNSKYQQAASSRAGKSTTSRTMKPRRAKTRKNLRKKSIPIATMPSTNHSQQQQQQQNQPQSQIHRVPSAQQVPSHFVSAKSPARIKPTPVARDSRTRAGPLKLTLPFTVGRSASSSFSIPVNVQEILAAQALGAKPSNIGGSQRKILRQHVSRATHPQSSTMFAQEQQQQQQHRISNKEAPAQSRLTHHDVTQDKMADRIFSRRFSRQHYDEVVEAGDSDEEGEMLKPVSVALADVEEMKLHIDTVENAMNILTEQLTKHKNEHLNYLNASVKDNTLANDTVFLTTLTNYTEQIQYTQAQIDSLKNHRSRMLMELDDLNITLQNSQVGEQAGVRPKRVKNKASLRSAPVKDQIPTVRLKGDWFDKALQPDNFPINNSTIEVYDDSHLNDGSVRLARETQPGKHSIMIR